MVVDRRSLFKAFTLMLYADGRLVILLSYWELM